MVAGREARGWNPRYSDASCDGLEPEDVAPAVRICHVFLVIVALGPLRQASRRHHRIGPSGHLLTLRIDWFPYATLPRSCLATGY